MKRVIIQADDLGLSPGVDRGVLRAFREGVLSSASLLACGPSFEHAVGLLRRSPDLRVGVHLSLIGTPPAAPPSEIPGLVDRAGRLPGSAAGLVFRLAASGRVEEIAAELGAQVDRVRAAGIDPTHLDSHKFVHCLPPVLEALILTAGRCGLERVRLPVFSGPGLLPQSPWPEAWMVAGRRALVSALGAGSLARLGRAGLRSPDRLLELEPSGDCTDQLCELLSAVGEGCTEIICHPAQIDTPLLAASRIGFARRLQLEALISSRARERIDERGIELVGYDAI
ncbi:MAG: ChbG/HpnK family deacetylase [Deltaproteobacteria bacterium]|nr:ChbG/HpnK family deacetylase [Deltaproteobacteria bacterium]